jgi:hypothetical protein
MSLGRGFSSEVLEGEGARCGWLRNPVSTVPGVGRGLDRPARRPAVAAPARHNATVTDPAHAQTTTRERIAT